MSFELLVFNTGLGTNEVSTKPALVDSESENLGRDPGGAQPDQGRRGHRVPVLLLRLRPLIAVAAGGR